MCLSISHAINPHGVISLGGAPLMSRSERGAGGRKEDGGNMQVGWVESYGGGGLRKCFWWKG